MNTSDKLKQLMNDLSDELIQGKEEEIKRLTAINEKLREENDRLKQQVQYKASDQSSSNLTRKATELRKALDEFFGQEVPNRRQMPFIPPSISIPSDVNKSSTTSENSKPYRSNPADDTLMNGTIHNHHGIHNFQEPNHDSAFSTQQNFRQETDTDIVNAATEMRQTLPPFHNQQNHIAHNGHHSFVPGLSNGRRFNNNNIGGLNNNNNNNNNRNRHNNNHNNNNNNNNNNSNNNSSSKYTIFIAWSGTSTVDQVRELFDPNDLVDIRYTPPKQFAHVDLKTENAMNKAMALNGTTKSEAQGSLRVETGKPRSSNTTENGQRQQNQTRTYNNNRQNNKNANGFNNGGLPQKKYNNPNYINHNRNNNNNNNHSGQYQNFGPAVEKENGTNGTTHEWQNFATTSVSNQEPKQNES